MILKEPDPFRGGEADVPARLVADRMVYYLRRHYRHSHDVDVLHDLRVPSGNAMASVDHLLLHAHGMVLIARQAGTEPVQIDAEGRWKRCSHNGTIEVTTPITQAYVQGLLLKSFLDTRVQQQGFFDRLELDVLVVVHDEVEIGWPRIGPLTEVCKRDDVCDRVTQRMAQCQQFADGPGLLTPAERRLLADFLSRSHRPGP